MSTRAAIARPDEGFGESHHHFAGVYHHWDGYPEGLGATLFTIQRSAFAGDLERMVAVLIDEHPAGWSTINNADWTLEPGFDDRGEHACICGEPNWKHYTQNYAGRGLAAPAPHPEVGPNAAFGHAFADRRDPHGPECYCHGGRAEEGWVVTHDNASGSGCEWVYVIDAKKRTMTVLSSMVEGRKMIGAFGMGDPDAEWWPIARVDLDGVEPEWETIAELEGEEVAP
jgi:hypothetical protein